MQRNGVALGFVIALLGVSPHISRAAAPANDDKPLLPDQTSFDNMLDRVRAAAAGVKWQQAGWSDPVIERWLTDVVANVHKVTEDDGYRMPVRFQDVLPQVAEPQPAAPPPAPAQPGPETPAEPVRPAPAGPRPVAARGESKNVLIVGDDVTVSHARNSIILARGNADVGFATECVIIAARAVTVAHGQQNVIAAGRFVHVSHDGRSTPVRGANGFMRQQGGGGVQMEVDKRRSVLVSGGGMDVSHAHGSACAASALLRISHANRCALINPPLDIRVGRDTDSRTLVAELELARAISPMADKVRVKWVVPRHGAVFRFQQRQYVADLGQPITDEAGKPEPALAGWIVSYADHGYVIFTKGQEEFGVAVSNDAGG